MIWTDGLNVFQNDQFHSESELKKYLFALANQVDQVGYKFEICSKLCLAEVWTEKLIWKMIGLVVLCPLQKLDCDWLSDLNDVRMVQRVM